MNLAWLQYQHGSKSEYQLLLLLAEESDRYCGLLSKEITDLEAANIRANLLLLDQMNHGDKIQWLKSNIANFTRAYREYRKDRARLDKTYDIKPLEVKQ